MSRQKLRDQSGQSLVELALVLPVLVILTLGLIDLSRAIQAHNAIVNMSREGANLASRTLLMQQTTDGAQMIMNTLAGTAPSLAMKTDGTMYVTQVEANGGVASVKSQTAWAQNHSAPPSAVSDSSLATILGTIPISDKGTVWIFEVFYKYHSMFAPSRAFEPQLHSIAIFAGGMK
jgi:Flp pilus assembly protein TadG